MPYRVIAQDIKTGEFLNWDVPLSELQITYTLSGPGVIAGKLNPEIPSLNVSAMEAWATWLHVEMDGQIRASGILQPVTLDGYSLTVESEGPSGYAHGIPFMGSISEIGIDPIDVVRRIWANIQSYPSANLGLVVDSTTKSAVKIGTPKPAEGDTNADPNAGPYTLQWWDHKDCGDEVNSLATQTPFDYHEWFQWNADKTDVIKHLDFGYPRLGRSRTDLRFAFRENILKAIPLAEMDDQYASDVICLGSGEGQDRIRGRASQDSGSRLRRVVVIADGSITTVARANAEAQAELKRRAARISMQQITIEANHPNAKLGSFTLGDDILVEGDFPWVGRMSLWHRITAYTWSPTATQATLTLKPSESFNYSPPLSGN